MIEFLSMLWSKETSFQRRTSCTPTLTSWILILNPWTLIKSIEIWRVMSQEIIKYGNSLLWILTPAPSFIKKNIFFLEKNYPEFCFFSYTLALLAIAGLIQCKVEGAGRSDLVCTYVVEWRLGTRLYTVNTVTTTRARRDIVNLWNMARTTSHSGNNGNE